MAKLDKMVAEAVWDGFKAGDEARAPFLYSSVMWEAWEIGRHLAFMGEPIVGLEKGRGSTWRTKTGSVWKVRYSSAGEKWRTIERLN